MARACLFISTNLLLCTCFLQAQLAVKPAKVDLTIVDSITNQPVGGANVELDRIQPLPLSVRHATSDEHGHASFPQVEPGQYRVASVQVDGYTYDPPDTLASSFTPITVAEGAVAHAGNVTVVPLGTVQGTVTEETGEPVVGADVIALRYNYLNGSKSLLPPAQAKPGKTDAQGKYRISGLLPGRYYVRVSVASSQSKTAFAPAYYPNADAASRAVRVEVSAGDATPPLNFRLRPSAAYHIRGSVSGIPDKTHVPTVGIHSCTPGVIESPAFTGGSVVQADSAFDAEGLPPGTYCLTFDDYAREVVTVIDRDIEGIRLAAAAPLIISGVVTLEEGASLRMPVSVDLRPAILLTDGQAMARVDGTSGAFRLAGVRPTDYKLAVSPIPTGGYIKSMKFGGRDVTDGNINTSGGGSLVIQIGAARGQLSGRVDFGSRKPRVLRVTLAPDGPLSNRIDLIRTAFTNDNGEFKITGLVPGSYKVFPWEKYDFDLAQSPEFLSIFSTNSVTIAEGDQPNIEVNMISAAEVEAAKARF